MVEIVDITNGHDKFSTAAAGAVKVATKQAQQIFQHPPVAVISPSTTTQLGYVPMIYINSKHSSPDAS